ncbi:hypothetical protein JFJ09_11225 [Pseudoalteromonas arctica]|jgi:hypothetical protein|uniref:hypothetical protein n=1 Tax=Pseudoalteromonas TaxID=53246 RepID=UPI0018CF9CC9|nr:MULTISPECIES: hypothetical protein [Pseudoalteromonas]MBH0015075.1 hypothetical protein [Pseudoalteromonas sp. NGC95]MBH0044879.1 hypothetical protein [Pseudoalteromonas sp. NZS11_1]MBZ2192788.1 hypothetical protein [Pseudoalteromonas arctica]
MSAKAENSMSYQFKRAIYSPVGELIYLTLFFGTITLAFFWLTIKWELLPASLVKPYLTQENTGLFDALGGWALGFAGALVAIRIAGVAKKIQENDSIREHVNLLGKHVERVSELNSKLTRSTVDAKRACAAVLLHAKNLNDLNKLSKVSHLMNSIDKNRTDKGMVEVNEQRHRQQQEKLQTKLEEKLEILIDTIDEAFKDSVYRSVLQIVSSEYTEKAIVFSDEDFTKKYFNSTETRKNLIAIVEEDNVFFNILKVIGSLGTRNFGIGLMELRSTLLFEHFYKDLMRITSFQQVDSESGKEPIEIADAAWLFLGLLISRSKIDGGRESNNDGFILMALMLGSLPTEKSIKTYLDTKKPEVVNDYSSAGRAFMEREVDELAKRMFFVKGKELSDIVKLIKMCNDNLGYLDVLTKNTGISLEAESVEDDRDAKNNRDAIESPDSHLDSRQNQPVKNEKAMLTGMSKDKKSGD